MAYRRGSYLWAVIRLAQGAIAAALLVIFALDVAAAVKPFRYEKRKWIYGLVVASYTTLSVAVFFRRKRGKRRAILVFLADSILLVLWIVQFALFARITLRLPYYLSGGPDTIDEAARKLLRIALLQLTNMLLCFFTAGLAAEHLLRGDFRTAALPASVGIGSSTDVSHTNNTPAYVEPGPRGGQGPPTSSFAGSSAVSPAYFPPRGGQGPPPSMA